jgi:hypothetical protein
MEVMRSDFRMSLSKNRGDSIMRSFCINLHLKPPSGGYRFWVIKPKNNIGKKKSTAKIGYTSEKY